MGLNGRKSRLGTVVLCMLAGSKSTRGTSAVDEVRARLGNSAPREDRSITRCSMPCAAAMSRAAFNSRACRWP
jgi:hypothetical protein